MEQPIGIRLPADIIEKIERISKHEMEDRSTTIRKLLLVGYRQRMREQSCDDYKKGKVTFSIAAKRTGLTLWEFEQALIASGFKSDYSIEDLEKELAQLAKKR